MELCTPVRHCCEYYYMQGSFSLTEPKGPFTRAYKLRFQVLTVASMMTVVFFILAPCSLVEFYRRFRGDCCLHHQSDRPDDGGGSNL
jgi:hypothetical protein